MNTVDHDSFFKKALENKRVQIEFFQQYLPKQLQDVVDIKNLKIEKDSFIENSLKKSFTDVLFSSTDNEKYIYLLLEHQSTSERFMAFRLLKYMINICDRHTKLYPKSKHLPLVYPIVLYNGKSKYTALRNVWDLFYDPDLAKKCFTDDYQLINLSEIPDEKLKEHPFSGLMAFFMKHIYERELINRWEEIQNLLPQLKITIDKVDTEYIKIILAYTINKVDKHNLPRLQNMLQCSTNKSEEIMGSIAHMWEQQGIEIGQAKGIEIGQAKGIEIGQAKGIEIGQAKGANKKAIEIAKKLLSQSIDINVISSATGLTAHEINKLKSK